MHLVHLLPRKIVKTLALLPIRAWALGGELVVLLSREVLAKLLQHLHTITVLMTLSSHHLMQRNIQLPKLLRRVVAEKRFCEDDCFQGARCEEG
jgi:hypothetical protein